MWLTKDEVGELTADDRGPCIRRSTQCERLAKMGIPFTTNFGGRPLVERSVVIKSRERAAKKPAEPNWGGMVA